MIIATAVMVVILVVFNIFFSQMFLSEYEKAQKIVSDGFEKFRNQRKDIKKVKMEIFKIQSKIASNLEAKDGYIDGNSLYSNRDKLSSLEFELECLEQCALDDFKEIERVVDKYEKEVEKLKAKKILKEEVIKKIIK